MQKTIALLSVLFLVGQACEGYQQISGRLVLKGALPKQQIVQISRNTEHFGLTRPDESLLINPHNKGIANVVVWAILSDPQLFKVPETVAFRVQKGRVIPRVTTMNWRQHLKLDIPTTPHLYSIKVIGSSLTSDQLMGFLPVGPVYEWHFEENSSFLQPIHCVLNPWLGGYVILLDHNYSDVSNCDGKFTMSHIPKSTESTIKLKMWHEEFGWIQQVKINGRTHKLHRGILEISRQQDLGEMQLRLRKNYRP
jgi:hypothetical protein